MRPITLIVVHHSASPLTTTATDISRWHSAPKPVGRGWRLGTGYHRVIEADGSVLDGRKVQRVGAHAKGSNTASIGICVVGNNTVAGQHWTDAQHDALKDALFYFALQYPYAYVCGHRDTKGANTLCPGLDIRNYCNVRGINVLTLDTETQEV